MEKEKIKILMPREKLLTFGASTLADHELLAIFLRTGIKDCPVMQLSQIVLNQFGSLRNLITAEQKQFCSIKGLRYYTIYSITSLYGNIRRYLLQELEEGYKFTNPDLVRMFLQTELENKEEKFYGLIFR